MARTLSSKSGVRAKSDAIGFTITGCPRAVYEMALDNMRKAGVSTNEVISSLIYKWAGLPSRLSAKYELISSLEDEAERVYDEKLAVMRQKAIAEFERVSAEEVAKEKSELEDTKRLFDELRPLVRTYFNKLHFGAAVGTPAKEEHELALGTIRSTLDGVTRTPKDSEVLVIYNEIKGES